MHQDSNTSDKDTSKPAKRVRRPAIAKQELIDLVEMLVGPMREGEIDFRRACAAVLALREVGIAAELLERSVVFDPEQWTRPNFLHAVRINSIKGRLFAGQGLEDWDSAVAMARQQMGMQGDYVDIDRAKIFDPKDFMLGNYPATDIKNEMMKALELARAQVSKYLMTHGVVPAATSRRGPRL